MTYYPTNRYRYVGHDKRFEGMTALGRWKSGGIGFVIQIDDLTHPWSHGWYLAIESDWEEIE